MTHVRKGEQHDDARSEEVRQRERADSREEEQRPRVVDGHVVDLRNKEEARLIQKHAEQNQGAAHALQAVAVYQGVTEAIRQRHAGEYRTDAEPRPHRVPVRSEEQHDARGEGDCTNDRDGGRKPAEAQRANRLGSVRTNTRQQCLLLLFADQPFTAPNSGVVYEPLTVVLLVHDASIDGVRRSMRGADVPVTVAICTIRWIGARRRRSVWAPKIATAPSGAQCRGMLPQVSQAHRTHRHGPNGPPRALASQTRLLVGTRSAVQRNERGQMSSPPSSHNAESLPSQHRTSALDSFGLFALIVMLTFAIAIVFALIGFASPSWLGFS